MCSSLSNSREVFECFWSQNFLNMKLDLNYTITRGKRKQDLNQPLRIVLEAFETQALTQS